MIIGVSGGEYGVRGYLNSYNAKTGAREWRTYTIPAPGEPGSETWPKDDTWKTGGAPTWLTGSYDPETNTVLWGTGNPGPWQADARPGDNLWSCSTVALDADTGKIKWGYQYTPNDAWDYDAMATPILVDVTVDGAPVKAAVQSNRNGYFYVLDRTDGRFVYAMPLVEGINWTTGLDPKTGKPTINEAKKPKTGGGTVEPIVPGLEGGTNWFPPAYDPDLGLFFVAVNQWGMGLTAWEKGKLDLQARRRLHGRRLPDVPHGRHHRAPQGDRHRRQEGGLGRAQRAAALRRDAGDQGRRAVHRRSARPRAGL